jgi:hypothetical protein
MAADDPRRVSAAARVPEGRRQATRPVPALPAEPFSLGGVNLKGSDSARQVAAAFEVSLGKALTAAAGQ